MPSLPFPGRTGLLLLALAACAPADAPEADDAPTLAVDTTRVAGPTSTVVVAYKGRLEDGSVFDESERSTFNLQRVVPGFRAGITGMHVGQTKAVFVPPEAGYGADPPPGIPPNAALSFEVTLLDIR
ncbi:FKBP-type peptidyl-prolyl cis-trans isomerase [Rubrivirga sp. IMCC45206]|uniref:FKBP-type peptidyl-prolyl cis-trans isomerase n=1 Tax=Rubrivirga sp. IMCC45206 TaxID=3391614 RepID=UPI00398FBA2B